MKKLSLCLTLLLAFGFSLPTHAGNLTPKKNDFGEVYIPDEGSATQTIKLSRAGGPPTITINAISGVGGPNAADFSIDTDGCTGADLPGPCDLIITFSPGGFFDRFASILINASGAANTDPPGDTDPVTPGTFILELTGTGTGCGDGILQSAFETCDFENPQSIDCCDDQCDPANDSDPCDGGGCLTSGTCSGGFCDGTPVADGTACDPNNLCVVGGSCQSGVCTAGDPIECPLPGECKVSLGCNPDSGCQEGNEPVGTACGDPGSGDVCDGSGNCVNAGANFTITKTPVPDPAGCGDNVVYTITVTNNGPENATGVEVVDTIPEGLGFVSAVSSQGGCNNALPPVCNLGDVAVGGSATVEVTVAPTEEGTLVNTATVSSDQSGPVSADASLDVSGGDCNGGGCSLSAAAASTPGSLSLLWIALTGIGLAIRLRRQG